MPKVSVIIPVYNVENYLRECLDSVVNQTLKDIEIICVDDGSTDSSLEILKEYAAKDERIIIIQQENKGAGAARNTGLNTASGEYVYFVDADDWLSVDCLEKTYNKISANNADVCIVNMHHYNDLTKEFTGYQYYDTSNYNVDENGIYTYKDFKHYLFKRFYVFTKMYNREYLVSTGIKFPENVYYEDVLFHINSVISANKVVFLFDKVYFYRSRRQDSFMNMINISEKYLNDIFKYIDDTKSLLEGKGIFEELEYEYYIFLTEQLAFHANRLKSNVANTLRNKCRNYFDKISMNDVLEKYPDLLPKYKTIFPKISVIIPVYNVEKYLRKCLDSVVNQTLKEIEIICLDDGSTDNSLEILKEYQAKDSRIIIIQQENKGAGAARNNGLNIASGDYIYFLDGDDYIDIDTLKLMYDKIITDNADICLTKEKKFDMCSSEFIKCDFSLVERLLPKTVPFSKIDVPKTILQITVPNVFIKLFRLEFLKENDLKFQEIKTCNDVYFSFGALLLAKSITYVNQELAVYRVNHAECLTKKRGKTAYCILLAYLKLRNKLEESGIFEQVKHTYYVAAINNFSSEMRYCMNREKISLLRIASNFFPKEYFNRFLKRNNCKYKLLFGFIEIIKYNKQNCITLFKLIRISYNNSLEKIFSIKNVGIRKVISIFGLKLKLKSRRLIEREKYGVLQNKIKAVKQNNTMLKKAIKEIVHFAATPIRDNSVLLVELNQCHGEVLTGMANVFLALGYNVDVILTKAEFDMKVFARIDNPNLRAFPLSKHAALFILNSNIVNQYKYIYLNSDIVYSDKKLTAELLHNIPFDKSKILQMFHRIENADNPIYGSMKRLMLADLPINQENFTIVNAHDFGVKWVHTKNEVTNFIIVGMIDKKRKNYDLLINSVQNLVNEGITNFKVTIVARSGSLEDIPKELQPYFDFKGKLDYEALWCEMEEADFFLTLLDPENPEHDRYITVGTSGSFQLIYGFRVPAIIAEKFTSVHRFNSSNSVVYGENSELTSAMKYAISMNNQEYNKLQANLAETADEFKKDSLNNLKNILETAKTPYSLNTK